MAFPPPVLPIIRTNANPQLTVHPGDHNAMAGALNDISARHQLDQAVRQQQTQQGSIPNNAWTILSVATLNYTYGQGFTYSDSTSIVDSLGGFYLAMGHVYWNGSNGNGRRCLGFSKDTSTIPAVDHYISASGTAAGQCQQITIPMQFPANYGMQAVCLWAYQDSGATIAVATNGFRVATAVRLTPPF